MTGRSRDNDTKGDDVAPGDEEPFTQSPIKQWAGLTKNGRDATGGGERRGLTSGRHPRNFMIPGSGQSTSRKNNT